VKPLQRTEAAYVFTVLISSTFKVCKAVFSSPPLLHGQKGLPRDSGTGEALTPTGDQALDVTGDIEEKLFLPITPPFLF
jgi:hypothetical protein